MGRFWQSSYTFAAIDGCHLPIKCPPGAYGVVVSMFDFHRSDRGSNPGRGGKIS